MEGTIWEVAMGLIFTPALVRCLLGPLSLSGPMTSTSWNHSYIATSYSHTGRYNPPLAAHPLHPLPPTHSLIHVVRDITVIVK